MYLQAKLAPHMLVGYFIGKFYGAITGTGNNITYSYARESHSSLTTQNYHQIYRYICHQIIQGPSSVDLAQDSKYIQLVIKI